MAGEDADYCAWVRQQPCSRLGHGDCLGAMHAHHPTGGKGTGQRNHDHGVTPLCTKHHSERHSLSGAYKGWDKRRLRSFEANEAERLRREYLGLGSDASLNF